MPHLDYVALIERDDGSTFTQNYKEFEDLLDLDEFMDEYYKIVQIF